MVFQLTSESVLNWKIENLSLRKGRIESPHFYYGSAEWCVEILLPDMCLSGDKIKIGFRQLTDRNIQANWSCAFLNSKGSLLNLSEQNHVTNDGKSCEACTWILNYEDTFNASNLPNDIVTIQSRIWYIPLNFDPGQSLLNTLLPRDDFELYGEVIRDTFMWWEKLLNLPHRVNTERTIPIPMTKDNVISIEFYRETRQRLKAILMVPTFAFLAKYKIYLLTNQKTFMQFEEDQFKSDNPSCIIFYLNFSTCDEIESCLNSKGLLRLFLSCMYCNNPIENNFTNNLNRNVIPNDKRRFCTKTISDEPQSRQQSPANTSSTIFQDLRSMYEEGFLSDFNLRVEDKTFPVHKNILGARSSVFRAMFTADMKEKESNHVNIPDVDADTIQRMLKFVYWDHVDNDLQCDSVCSLFSAADKYALESLKQRCSSHLSANLSAANVLCVLLLSDTHQDKVLKAEALDFISRNDKEIIGMERWSKFTEEHGPLSLEILQQLYLKKMAG